MPKKILRMMLLLLSVFFAALSVYRELFIADDSIKLTLLLNAASVILIYLHYLSGGKDMKKKRNYLFYAFLLYLVLMISLLFIDARFLRDKIFDYDIVSYANDHLNLIPFKTILLYIDAYKSGYLPLSEVFINLAGNLVAFMPLGFFLPNIFPRLNHTKYFILYVSVLIFTVELLQILMQTGVCDVDDLILNLTGALLVYFFARKRNARTKTGD